MICPTCNGKGLQPIAFPHNRKMCTLPCTRCHGEKEVSDETPKWREMGKILKSRRIDLRITLRNACKMLDLDPNLMSDMERGCMEPDMTINYKDAIRDKSMRDRIS